MLRLTTLGAIDLRDGRGHPIRGVLTQPKRVALLAYLVVEGHRIGGDGVVSRDRLLALFWPESDDARARNTLSQSLHHLRAVLGADVIENRGATGLSVRRDLLWCDATEFTDALKRGDAELALDMYRGEFCPMLFADGSPDLQEWIDGQRRHLRTHALAAARGVAEQLATRGDGAGAARAARRALALHPDDEGDVRVLLGVLEQTGDVAGVLLAYQEYARRLAAELETEPSPETQRLVETIRRRREQAATAGAPPRASMDPVAPLLRLVPRARHPRVFMAAAVVVVALAGATAFGWRSGRGGAPQLKTIAVFPFATQSGTWSAYLHSGMVDLLSAKLEGVSGFHAIDPRSVVAAVAAQDRAGPLPADASARIARQLGARWYITGAAVEVAGRLQLTGTLVDVNARTGSQPVATAEVVGDTAALFALVDDLAGRMLVRLSTGRDTALTRLAAVTTHSLPALKKFLDGEREQRAGHDAQAAAAFREATLLDTSFALAQYRLAMAATWVSVRDAEDPAVTAATASRHAQRLSPLVRDLLSAYRAYKELRPEDAERMYRGLTESHPDNVEAWFMLAETLFHYNAWRGRSPSDAWPMFQRVLSLDPTNAHAMVHLARLAALDGRASELDSLTRRYVAAYPDAERALEIRALNAYVRDDATARAAVAAAARDADEHVVTGLLQAAIVYAQNLDAARELAEPLGRAAGTPAFRRFRQRYFSELHLAEGRWSRAQGAQMREFVVDENWVLELQVLLAVEPFFSAPSVLIAALRDSVAARQPYQLLGPPYTRPDHGVGSAWQAYLLGLLSARLGDTTAAARHLAALGAIGDASRAAMAHQLAYGLRAEIARANGNLSRAIAELEQFAFDDVAPLWVISHWGIHERFLRAELLRALNREPEALRWYDSFPSGYDTPYLAGAHFRRGEIYERQGNRERAAFHYTRFISLWRDADPEYAPLVVQARRALSALGAAR